MFITTPSEVKNNSFPLSQEGDFLQIKKIDHVHFWVGNAKQSMYYWWKAFGFKPVAYSGLETGNRRYASYVLESGQIRFVLSTAYNPSDEMAAHHLVHGDGVKVIALEVDDVSKAYTTAVNRGALPAWAPREESDKWGSFQTAAINTYGEVLHVFVDRSSYHGPFAPTYQALR
jgi:4-hydroxyphenylpyruvate dioxygenase